MDAKENPGRRPFPRKERYFEILSMGKSIVVSATPERLAIAQSQMQGKSRDAVFSLPFIRGLYLHFLPDVTKIKPMSPPDLFTFEWMGREEVHRLFADTEGPKFREAVIYDPNLPWQTDLIMVAKKKGEIVGVAGASKTCAKLWQIGDDVFRMGKVKEFKGR